MGAGRDGESLVCKSSLFLNMGDVDELLKILNIGKGWEAWEGWRGRTETNTLKICWSY